MGSKIGEQVERCVQELGAGTLTASSLRRIAEIDGDSTVQDILYLQATTTSPTSEVVGMRIIENGEISDGPHDPDDWPYQTVLEAVRDGWRIIKFPELALMLDDSRTYGLGFEFILEREGRL